ncbi:hypothetical protein G8E10_17805 [Rhizobiaceae bacterium CRRU44]|uniref:Polysaccharide lyase family 7 protein n=1 Tax=Ferranicluibacter rubi TaxID=2715133 RepID=A0AA43ZIL6_9HYPH|nr:hypothetical protein [Ferranicluibacter rubi]NHT77572.1 hypothetical protein [Ferranicluibacter rubi]
MSLRISTRALRIAFACSLTLLSSAASAEQLFNVERTLPPSGSDGVELIADPKFEAGFSATPACNSPEAGACAENTRYDLKSPAYPEMADVKPVWELRQWGSRSSFTADPQKFGDGYGWANLEKRLVLHPGGLVEMAVNGDSEFAGKYGDTSRSAPSLIAGQTISAPGTYSRDTGSIKDMKKLIFNMEFKLPYDDENKKAGYDANRHAILFPVNITIQNLNNKSKGYGQYVWLQVGFYDDRQAKPVEKMDQALVDPGTKMLIYFVPADRMTTGNAHSGEWIKFNGDILPSAKRSVEMGFERGILTSGDIADYKIGGFNLGYELTGLNITTMEFRDLSLRMFKD